MTTEVKNTLSPQKPGLKRAREVQPEIFAELMSKDATPYEKISIKLAISAVKGLRGKNVKQQRADLNWLNGAPALIPFQVVCDVLGLDVALTLELIAERTGNYYKHGYGIILSQP